jgi:hypothetical protein
MVSQIVVSGKTRQSSPQNTQIESEPARIYTNPVGSNHIGNSFKIPTLPNFSSEARFGWLD